MENNAKPKYLGIREMAEMLGCSWNLVRNRVLPNVEHIKIGRKYMVAEEAFYRYLKRLERGV